MIEASISLIVTLIQREKKEGKLMKGRNKPQDYNPCARPSLPQ